MLTFYYAPGTCARAVHIALEDAGAAYERRRVDFAKAEQRSPDYLKINPKGRVPALVTDRGALTETPALLVYVAQTHPQAKLAPLDDPFAFAEMQGFAAYLASTVHIVHAHRPRGSRWADEPASIADMRAKTPANMRECFGLIERQLFRGPWAMGAAYSVIDPYLFTLAGWLGSHGVAIEEFPAIAEHTRRMSVRDSVRRALAAEAA
ncbi:MAG TPA: glutathione S-transferase family protein [Roseiarcus sp.]|nr:glutathione S-transferase family protein [Roseiarcus sp.]